MKAIDSKVKGFIDALIIGATTGLVAGAVVGVVEGIFILARTSSTDLTILPYAALLYSLIALALGFGLGIVAWMGSKTIFRDGLDRAGTWATLLCADLFMLLFVIARYRLLRDLFEEKLKTMEPKGLLFHTALGLVCLIGFLVLSRWILAPIARRWGLFGRLAGRAGTAGLYLCILATAAAVGILPGLIAEEEAVVVPEALKRGEDGRPNFVYIMIDTQRADRLSCYGYSKQTSPNIDGLASDGVLFTKTIAQASWTKPSIATAFTSLYPSSHQAVHKHNLLPDDVVTLAEAMRAGGYYTAGFANNINIAPSFNFDQGFETYVFLEPDYFFSANETSSQLAFYNVLRLLRERLLVKTKSVMHYYQDATVVNEHVLAWLQDNMDTRFFLFVHYMDPHDPYFIHPYNGVGYARVDRPNPPPETAGTLSEVYDDEVAFCDRHIGELVSWMKEKGLYDDTVFLVTGDHGEEFYEHGGWWHGTTLYEEQVHIPLIVKLQNSEKAGTSVDRLVRNLDIPPTIADIAGIELPSTWQGKPLLGAEGSQATEEPVFSEEDFEGNVIRSMRGRDYKLILASEGNPRGLDPVELYRIDEDPAESRNLATEEVAGPVVPRLRAAIDRTEEYARDKAVSSMSRELDDATRERLKALGYIQ